MTRTPDDESPELASNAATRKPELRDREDEGRVPSRAGGQYAGDHKNHGELDVEDDDVVEELDLDEMPSFEGPDA